MGGDGESSQKEIASESGEGMKKIPPLTVPYSPILRSRVSDRVRIAWDSRQDTTADLERLLVRDHYRFNGEAIVRRVGARDAQTYKSRSRGDSGISGRERSKTQEIKTKLEHEMLKKLRARYVCDRVGRRRCRGSCGFCRVNVLPRRSPRPDANHPSCDGG